MTSNLQRYIILPKLTKLINCADLISLIIQCVGRVKKITQSMNRTVNRLMFNIFLIFLKVCKKILIPYIIL